MAINLILPVPDVDAIIGTASNKYDSIRLYRATSRGGAYSLVTTIALVALTTRYLYTDNAGATSSWYKVTYYNSALLTETALAESQPFPATHGTTSLTTLRERIIRRFGGEVYTPTALGAQSITIPDAADTGLDTDYYSGWHIYRPASATAADNDRRITLWTPASGLFTQAGRAYADQTVGLETVELCNIDISFVALNDVIGDGLMNARYLYRYEFGATDSTMQYSLPNFVEGPEYVPEAWLRWGQSSGDYRWEPLNMYGRWWKVRGSSFQCTLDIMPSRAANEVIGLDVWRPGEKLDGEADFTQVHPLWADAVAMVAVIEYLITRDIGRHNTSNYGPMLDLWSKKLRQYSRKYGPTGEMKVQVPSPISGFPQV